MDRFYSGNSYATGLRLGLWGWCDWPCHEPTQGVARMSVKHRKALGFNGLPIGPEPLRYAGEVWCARRDSNPRPSVPKTDALSTELRADAK